MSYLEALDRELADLAPDERADLLDEVEASLAEIGGDPEIRLGPANRFAAELRASAGLPPALEEHAPPRPSLKDKLAPAAKELAPIWWVIRAYVAVVIAAELFAKPSTYISGIPRFGPSAEAGAAVLAAAIVASIALGLAARRHPTRARPARIAVDLALLAATLFLVGYEFNNRVLLDIKPQPAQALPSELMYYGAPVRNIYAYDRKGNFLRDVQLFDEYGRPLEIGRNEQDPNRRLLKTAKGQPVFNTFPIRYFEPGSTRVKDMQAAPNIRPRAVTTRTPASP